MRLIDADALKKILSEHEMKHDKRRSFDDYDCGAANAYEYAGELLDEMPTIEINTNDIEYKAYSKGLDDGQAIAIPHGEWLKEPHSRIIHCSNCGAEENMNKIHVAKWCYSCGADMRKEV